MEKSLGQKIFYTVITILLLVALVPVLWYGYIKIFGGEKFTSSTVYLNQLKDAQGNTENILYVDYHTNANKNGVECLDIKFNYFTDEKRENIYWQGLQYVANSKQDKIQWYNQKQIIDNDLYYLAEKNDAYKSYEIKKTQGFLKTNMYFAGYVSPFVNPKTTERYTYQSLDEFETLNSTNPLDENSYLTLQAGEDLIYLKLKGSGYAHDKATGKYLKDYAPIGEREMDYLFSYGFVNIYNYFGIDYLAYQIYNAIQTLPAGTNSQQTMELGDIFKYYKADEDKNVGTEISTKDRDLVDHYMKTYFTFQVKISADGVKQADDSMFKVVHGSSSYKLDGATGENGEYFTGRQIIDLDYRHFDKVLISGTDYAFKLRNDVLNAYLPHKSKISLRITIDQSALIEDGIKFIGYTSDSGLENFKIEETIIIPLAEVT